MLPSFSFSISLSFSLSLSLELSFTRRRLDRPHRRFSLALTRPTTIITRLPPENCAGVRPLLDIRSLSPPHFYRRPSARYYDNRRREGTTATRDDVSRRCETRDDRRRDRGVDTCGARCADRRRSRGINPAEKRARRWRKRAPFSLSLSLFLCLSGSTNRQLALRSLVLVYLGVSRFVLGLASPRPVGSSMPCVQQLRAYRAPPLVLFSRLPLSRYSPRIRDLYSGLRRWLD